jgi:hypothetical protein
MTESKIMFSAYGGIGVLTEGDLLNLVILI